MINTINSTSSAYGLSGIGAKTTSADSSSSDFLSSFKDILSTMMNVNGSLSSGEQSNSGIGDLMTPLLMIILLEKLVESQMDMDASTGDTSANNTQMETAATTATTSTASPQTARAIPSGRPVGGFISQEFHPGHNGLDFGVVVGTPVETTMNGKVTYAGWNNQGYGNLVIVQNGEYKTYYAHLSSIPVSVGDSVTAGSTIGLSGNTGNSTGPHLHYEIRKNNVAIDPTSATLGA
jgi:murein DD-endopeptidase MepM/ murein hydrolase activator NlpD